MSFRIMIATVGKIANPLVISYDHHQPDAVILIASSATKSTANELLEYWQSDSSNKYFHCFELQNGEDFKEAYRTALSALDIALDWSSSSSDPRFIVEFTFGTKVMSAALVLAFVGKGAVWSYISGERDELGSVIPSSEKVITLPDPVENQIEQEFINFQETWNSWRLKEAEFFLDRIFRCTLSSIQKDFFTSLKEVVQGLYFWDSLKYEQALDKLETSLPTSLKLAEQLDKANSQRVLKEISEKHLPRLRKLVESKRDKFLVLPEILSTAQRCAVAGRFDEALNCYKRSIRIVKEIEEQMSVHNQPSFTEDATSGKLAQLLDNYEKVVMQQGLPLQHEAICSELEGYLLEKYESLGFSPSPSLPMW